MSDLKFISPILDNLLVNDSEPISDHHGIKCYAALNPETNAKYILKVISIPASRSQLDAFLLSGAYSDEASALVYFQEQTEDIIKESDVLQKLAQLEGFLPYEKVQVVPMDNEVGFQVYLLSAYQKTLERFLRKQPMTHLGAVNLGLDLCAALTICRRSGFMYADLKPSNIYIAEDKTYKIGDLGFLRLDSLKYASLPAKYQSKYTAPEITDAFSTVNATLDVYSVGKILYEIYNNGDFPVIEDNAELPAPVNADYEMTEIILKACAATAEDRWEDPAQMGQALVSYMQRNGVNDVPIVPPSIPTVSDVDDDLGANIIESETSSCTTDINNEPNVADESTIIQAEEEADISDVSAQDTVTPEFQDEELNNISSLLQPSADETAPENNELDVEYEETSDDTNELLAQIDEIAAHQIPEPPAVPEPVDIPIPTAIAVEENADENISLKDVNDEQEDNNEAAPEQTDIEDNAQPEEAAEANDDSPKESECTFEESADSSADDPTAVHDENQEAEFKPKKKRNWPLYTLLVLLIGGLIALAVYFYCNYYLLPVKDITIQGVENQLTVTVHTTVDESLLTVVCKGHNGEVITAALSNGTAEFTNLNPNTVYNISVTTSGFHKLTGKTSVDYSTPKETEITDFTILTGKTPGSVVVNFSVTGKDTDQWHLIYSANGEAEKRILLESKEETIPNLTIGKKYTFTLEPSEPLYLIGSNQIEHTVLSPAMPEQLTIDSCINNKLVVSWNVPQNTTTEWNVICTDLDGNKNTDAEIVIGDNGRATATITGIESSKAYYITVIAAGMKEGITVDKSENTPSLIYDTCEIGDNGLDMKWTCSEDLGELTISYTIDNQPVASQITTSQNQFELQNLIPGAEYCITIKTSDGTIPYGGYKVFSIEDANSFSMKQGTLNLTNKDMTFRLCAPPSREPWRSTDRKVEYTSEFVSGEKAGIVIDIDSSKNHGDSIENITRLFVIYNNEDIPVVVTSTQMEWNYMWPTGNTCELTIPEMPTAIGEYKLCLYFNGQFVTEQSFTITG